LLLPSLPEINEYWRPIFLSGPAAELGLTRLRSFLGKGKRMYLLLWILVGLIGGWLAGKGLEGNGYGPSMDLVMGAGGAVAGGLLIRAAGFSGYGGTAFSTFVAICCAAVVTIVAALANGRTIYSRGLSVRSR
jgi:uncharacterized membrane protein YeaQ/YmgE (transglycosylase-associated protein family)